MGLSLRSSSFYNDLELNNIELEHTCVNNFDYVCQVFEKLDLIKGIHPGFILERELQKRNLVKGRFAISVDEFPQTLVSITKGKRKMNTALAIRIENALDLPEGYLMTLQVFHDIAKKKKSSAKGKPDLTKLRSALFWETEISEIDWSRQRESVIRRTFEYGSHVEKNEIRRFYGDEAVNSLMGEKGE